MRVEFCYDGFYQTGLPHGQKDARKLVFVALTRHYLRTEGK